MSPKTKTILMTFVCSLAIGVISCGKKKDDSKDDDSDQTFGTVRGNGSGGDTSTASLEVQQLSYVHSKMIPASLAVTGANLTADNDNLCGDAEGFFDCQPNLLKFYVTLSQSVVGFTTDMYAALDKNVLPSLPLGKGSLDLNEADDGLTALQYNIVSANEYSLLGLSSKGATFHFEVKRSETGTSYILEHDGDNEVKDGGDANKGSIKINYVSDTEFTVEFDMNGQVCDPKDLRSPQNINIKTAYKDGVWTGKAQMYMPRWLFAEGDGVTCDTASSDALKMFFYTDFVGTDVNTTASIYLADKTLTDQANFASYEASDFCSNHPAMCYNGYGFGDPKPVASYTNPFCATTTGSTWGSACDDLGNELFGSANLWYLPAVLEGRAVTLPESL